MENEKAGQVDYHYGFYAAIHFDYEFLNLKITLQQELELGDQPVRVDMVVIKRNRRRALSDPIGRAFKGRNILEYKSPRKSLTINDFYKVQGYACIYKSLSKRVNAIPIEDLTITIFCHMYPRKMFADLKKEGFNLEEVRGGIYYVRGPLFIFTQIVVISRLPEGEYEELKILAPKAKKEDVAKFLDKASKNPSDHVSAILRVSMAANEDLYQKLGVEGPMKDVFESIFHKELSAAKNEGWTAGRNEERANIISRMLAGGMTPQQIADIIALPLSEVLALSGGA